jgi:hypothetical protein
MILGRMKAIGRATKLILCGRKKVASDKQWRNSIGVRNHDITSALFFKKMYVSTRLLAAAA